MIRAVNLHAWQELADPSNRSRVRSGAIPSSLFRGCSRRTLLSITLVIAVVGSGRAQEERAALGAGVKAYEVGDFSRAATLLARGLDPRAGPLDSTWAFGVHVLADILIAGGGTSLADVWLRWAVRVQPELRADSINFPPAVTHAVLAAQTAARSSQFDTATATVTWEWTAELGRGDRGVVRVQSTTVALGVEARGFGSLGAGGERSAPPGTYTFAATAPDHIPTSASAEVLPGVVTVIRFDLERGIGYLYVVSRPWGEVFLDGERLGYSMISGRPVPTGTHRLRITRDGYVPFDTTIAVKGDERLRLGPIRLLSRSPEDQ